jgi:hypothetical protein
MVMTLEEKINTYIHHSAGVWNIPMNPIEDWIYPQTYPLQGHLDSQIMHLIQEASLVECLTSPSHFIRECKRIMEQSQNV